MASSLAEKFKVKEACVWKIAHRYTWKHLAEEVKP